MQLTSIQPAINSGGGGVTRSTAAPGAASSAGPRPVTAPGIRSAPSSPASADSITPAPTPPRSDSTDGVDVSISQQARQTNPGDGTRNGSGADDSAPSQGSDKPGNAARPERSEDGARAEQGQGSDDPSSEQEAVVQELKSRDQQVRQHEQAHRTTGGQYAGAPTYTYQRGSDGQLYAVGGQVAIDASPIPDDPEATISKMQTVRSAALAPADPSPQDIRVAQEATRQLLQAQSELRAERRDGTGDGSGPPEGLSQEAERPSGAQADARLGLFRAVDGFASPDAGQSSEAQSGFRATA